jgi:hypothetical protein
MPCGRFAFIRLLASGFAVQSVPYGILNNGVDKCWKHLSDVRASECNRITEKRVGAFITGDVGARRNLLLMTEKQVSE